MNRCHFIFDRTASSIKFKKTIQKKFKSFPISKSDVIVVVGGDGFMLKTIKKFYKFKKLFYGINCGSVGFLMNKHVSNHIDKSIRRSKIITINPLQITTVNSKKITNKFLAINELSLLRQSKQTSSLRLKINEKILVKKLVGDGVLVSTPAGSTAYNLSVSGPILSLNSKKLAITPISPFRPRRWKGRVVTDNKKIFIKNLDPKKRPIAAVSDNNEIRNIQNVYIKSNKKIKFKLLFNSRESLIKKIKLEQKKKIN